jgi:hypothetical protein
MFYWYTLCTLATDGKFLVTTKAGADKHEQWQENLALAVPAIAIFSTALSPPNFFSS